MRVGWRGLEFPRFACRFATAIFNEDSHTDLLPRRSHRAQLGFDRHAVLLEDDFGDDEVFDGEVQGRSRDRRCAVSDRIDRDLSLGQLARCREWIGVEGGHRAVRTVRQQQHPKRPSVTHFTQHLIEDFSKRGLFASRFGESRIERRQFTAKVELPDFDLLAELLPARLKAFEVGADRLEASLLVRHVGRVHAPADIGQNEQLNGRFIRLRLLNGRAKHREDQQHDRQQPQPQQHPRCSRRDRLQLRAVRRPDQHRQPHTRQHNERPRPDRFDAERHATKKSKGSGNEIWGRSQRSQPGVRHEARRLHDRTVALLNLGYWMSRSRNCDGAVSMGIGLHALARPRRSSVTVTPQFKKGDCPSSTTSGLTCFADLPYSSPGIMVAVPTLAALMNPDGPRCMRLLERYVLTELLRVFGILVTISTTLLVCVGAFGQAKEYGLGHWQILQILPFIVPSLLPYTIPATLLLSVCVVYGCRATTRSSRRRRRAST